MLVYWDQKLVLCKNCRYNSNRAPTRRLSNDHKGQQGDNHLDWEHFQGKYTFLESSTLTIVIRLRRLRIE